MAPERTRSFSWTGLQGHGAFRTIQQKGSPPRAANESCGRSSGGGRDIYCRKVQGHCSVGCSHCHGRGTHTTRRRGMRRSLGGQVRQTGSFVLVSQRNARSRSAAAAFTRRTGQAGSSPFWFEFLDIRRAQHLPTNLENSPAPDCQEGWFGGETQRARTPQKFSSVPLERPNQPRHAALAVCRAGGVRA